MKQLKHIREHWSGMLLGEFSPHEIALGFAIGTTVSLLPTFGFSILIMLALLVFFPRMNRPAALLALAFWNPLVQIPVYTLSFQFGSILYADEPIMRFDFFFFDHVYSFTRRYVIGHLIVVSTLTLLSYAALYVLARAYLRKLPEADLHTHS